MDDFFANLSEKIEFKRINGSDQIAKDETSPFTLISILSLSSREDCREISLGELTSQISDFKALTSNFELFFPK